MSITASRAEKGLYDAARKFVERGLLKDDSIFTPGRAIWTAAALDDFHERYVVHGDSGDDPFEVKLERQLDGADETTIQFVGELLFVHFLAPHDTSASKKLEHIDTAFSLLDDPVEVPEDLETALGKGVSSFGIARTNRYDQVRLLLEFTRAWKRLEKEEQRALVRDPWAFKDFLFDQDISGGQIQAHTLLHLIHPEYFEPIGSRGDKQKIVDTWEDLVEEPVDDLDRRLRQIRDALQEKYGEGFAFHDPRVRAVWQSKEEPWDEFVEWARRFYQWDGFDQDERIYKLEVGEALAEVHELLSAGENWIAGLKTALSTNLPSGHVRGAFLKWCRAEPDRAREALLTLWEGDGVLVERIDRFLEVVPEGRIRLTSVLLMRLGPTEHPPYATRAFEKAFDLTGHPPPHKDATNGERYRHALAFLDRIKDQAAQRDLELRDRLDAQSVLWCITKTDQDSARVAHWDDEEWHRFQVFRDEREKGNGGGNGGNGSGPEPPTTLDQLADELLIDRSFLGRIRRLLREKGQVIFYGPPGTGKTYVAQELARVLAGSPEAHRLVQFHPSYAYEDFVEGYRPGEGGGPSGFELRPGPLREIARRARENPDENHLLIIDEINRGNVARVFGELYFLLEYRGQEIHLQYSGDGFTLPENLWIIGTMNTADRSIALMDAALRRRFYFAPFFPQEPPIEGLLRRWLDRHAPDLRWVADVVKVANRRLDDPHFAIGPSYFMREDLTEEWVETVWKHSVLPYLEERFFGEQEALARFRLDELRGVVQGTSPEPGEGSGPLEADERSRGTEAGEEREREAGSDA